MLRNLITSRVSIVALLVALGLSSLFTAQSVRAQQVGPGEGSAGPYGIAAENDAGPYHVVVWQSPERVVTGAIQFAIEITNASTGANIDVAKVNLLATPSSKGQAQTVPALNSPANRKYYQGNMEVPDAGNWAVDVDIDGPLGTARLTYATEVFERSRSGSSLAVGTTMFILVQVVIVGAVAYLWWSGRRRRRMAAVS